MPLRATLRSGVAVARHPPLSGPVHPPRRRLRRNALTSFHTMDYRLDETDRQLLRLLQTKARASTAHLARQMDLARTTVVARIARLEQEGIIAGYGVRLGQRMEQASVRAYCGIRVQPKTATSVMQALNRFTEVEEVSAVSGQYDYMVFVRCESNEKLDALLDRIGLIDGIQQTYTSVVLSRKIDRRMTAALSQLAESAA